MLGSLFTHPTFARRLTAAHHELAERARAILDPARLSVWRRGERGQLDRDTWRELGAAGLIGVSLPAELGGRGLGLAGALIVSEAAIAAGDLGLSLGLHCQSEISAQWLATAHDETLRERWLPEMLAGRAIGCNCDTEPGGSLTTTAVHQGDELVITGRKRYIVNGANAHLCLVTAKLDAEMVTILVEKDRPGVSVTHVFDKLGTRGIDSAEIAFDHVRVPAAHLSTRRGVQQLMQWNKVMTAARFLMSADACFLHERMLESALEHGRARVVDGRPLASWPIQAQGFAAAAADLELMRASLADRLERIERGKNVVAEVAATKWFCVDRACRFAAQATELEGGAGYMWGSALLHGQAELLGLKMAGGSLTTMKSIANQALVYREEMEDLA